MEGFATFLDRCSSEIYLNNKDKLRGQMFSAIAYFTVNIMNGTLKDEEIKEYNKIYKDFMICSLNGNKKARDHFNKLSLMNDRNTAVVFEAKSKLGAMDYMPERDWDKNIVNFDWEEGCIGVEVQREASSVVRF